jgi:hypothetical protein
MSVAQTPVASSTKKNTIIDLCTVFGAVTLDVLAFNSGSPAAAGIAMAVTTYPTIMAALGLMTRVLANPKDTLAIELSKTTGLGKIRDGIKEQNWKARGGAAAFLTVVGLFSSAAVLDDKRDTKKAEELASRITLMPETIVQHKAWDYCHTNSGRQFSSGTIVPFNINDTKYKVICP